MPEKRNRNYCQLCESGDPALSVVLPLLNHYTIALVTMETSSR